MAAISAATPVTCSSLSSSVSKRKTGVSYIQGLNSFDGLKANTRVSSLGRLACTAQSFDKVVSSLRPKKSKIGEGGGGALSSTCNAAEEIFRIAAIMNGLVLVGVAVGFVLLRVEAWVEEQEE